MVAQASLGKEVLEVAIEIERNGKSLYDRLAKQAKTEAVQNIYVYLATQEKDHENTFRAILNRLGGYQPPQPSAEHYQYIKDLADAEIFVGERVQALLAKQTVNETEALDIAIGFEKDSILLYSEIRGFLPKADQDIVETVIFEEKRHLRELMDLKKGSRA